MNKKHDSDVGPSILVSIGGGEDAFLGLRYAARIQDHGCANIDLLYVRPLDQGMRSGGLEVRVARENILDWGLDLPGLRQLKKGRDILVELGELSRDAPVTLRHASTSGDPLGDYTLEYTTECGSRISLCLRASENLLAAILAECRRRNYDLVIVGVSGAPRGPFKRLLEGMPLSERIAREACRSVLVARHLEGGYSHLVCTDGSSHAQAAVAQAARLSSHCRCPITIIAVAPTQADLDLARSWAEEAGRIVLEQSAVLADKVVLHGDPAEEIVREGRNHSVIMIAEPSRKGLRRRFGSEICYTVLRKAETSVMIIR